MDQPDHPTLRILLAGAALCNNARVQEENDNQVAYVGEPTEVALLEIAELAGLHQSELERMAPRRQEIPFDSDRKQARIHK